jgi:exodeoxyribonuclease VII small subunit
MNAMAKSLTYESALAELIAIAREIESGTASIDTLAEKVKRASELIRFCQSKLRDTETEVNRIIGGMQGVEGEEDDGTEV